jgi:hypothetical protein
MLTPILQNDACAASRPNDTIEDFHLIISHLAPRYPVQHAFWQQRTRRLAALRELADVIGRRYGKPLLFQRVISVPDAIFDQDRSRLAPLNADVADVLGDQEQRGNHPNADVAEAPDTSAEIPHGVHWW